jgi:hypothetical protein
MQRLDRRHPHPRDQVRAWTDDDRDLRIRHRAEVRRFGMAHVHEEVRIQRQRPIDVIGVALPGVDPEGLAGCGCRSAEVGVLLITHTGCTEAIGTGERSLRCPCHDLQLDRQPRLGDQQPLDPGDPTLTELDRRRRPRADHDLQ